MFDGVPDHLHQFIASSRTSLPLHLSFSSSLHQHASSNTNIFPIFDPYTTTSQQVPLQIQPQYLHPLHQQSATQKNDEDRQDSSLVGMNFDIERERSISVPIDPAWSKDEVLALLRIRSSLENWFPEFTWEHVSRKLEELGYKRTAEKCKEKFEEEGRCLNNINYSKNYRFFSEFEELYQGQNTQVVAEKNKKMEKAREEEDMMEQNLDEDSKKEQSVGDPSEDNEKLVEKSKDKKRKRQKNFEIFKGFCEDIVKRMMAQQEVMHNKLLEDMMKRDEEKVAREEAWKKQEMDRIDKELEIRAYELGIAGDRQAAIIKFLKDFTSSGSSENQCFAGRNGESPVTVLNTLNHPISSSSIIAQNPNPTCQVDKQNKLELPTSSTMSLGHQTSGSCPTQKNPVASTSLPGSLAAQNPSSNLTPTTAKEPSSSAIDLSPQNPSSPNTQNKPSTPTSISPLNAPHYHAINDKEDLGKRWPRDEVFALINLRCSVYNNGEDKEGGGAAAAAKTPLWERISQGMLDLGYKRSAKRCKEKWENINKYFRKTKDTNKKRSLDSRTCPYFHQLSTLYNQGTLIAPSEGTENRSAALPENQHGSSQAGSNTDSTMHVAQELH